MELLDINTELIQKIENENELNRIRLLFLNKINNNENQHLNDIFKNKYPGTRYDYLHKRDFNFLKRNNYWVCEKSEGVKVLILFTKEQIYFYDDCGSIFSISSNNFFLPSIGNPSSPQDQTLIDGEMTFNFHYTKYCVMIIDVLYVEGENITKLSLSKRLQAIRERIIVPYRNKYPDDKDQEILPLVLLGKEYLKLSNINKIFDKIKHYECSREEEGSGHRFLYTNGKRYNDNNGIIFTPEDKEYRPWKNNFIKRWKWNIFNTVNFLVKHTKIKGKDVFKLFVRIPGNDSNLMEYRTAFFSRECANRLLSDLKGENGAIIECAYDSKSIGEWVYYRIQNNKIYPDSFATVFSTLEIMTENITRDDLLKHFCNQIINKLSIERPHTTPHKPTYPTSTERTTEDVSPHTNNIERAADTLDEISPKRGDIIYESPSHTLNQQDNKIIGIKRKMDDFKSIDELEQDQNEYAIDIKKARVEE